MKPKMYIVSLVVLLLVMASALTYLFPTRVTPEDATAERFSARRALVHLPVIAAQPHPLRSPAQRGVRDYLVSQLTALGLETEVQSARGIENVVARLRGGQPSGAIVVLAHYDSNYASPGAADNGAGVAALLEIMRALSAGPALQNDVIALFDDGEEAGGGNAAFTGSKAFVALHPWMADVRIAISLDTAVAGFVAVNEIGPRNGWMVDVLDRAYTGGTWLSTSGGGGYDYTPFRQAGIQGIALEDNYPFRQKHTPDDLPEIVRAASVQQMGEQTLAIARRLGELDLSSPWGEQKLYFSVPVLGFVNYPEAWAVPLVAAASILLLAAVGLAIRDGFAGWRGLGAALLVSLGFAAASAAAVNIIFARLPVWAGWQTHNWPDWPEVIPPYGGVYLLGCALLILGIARLVYEWVRRWAAPADFVLVGLALFLVLAVAFAIALPRASFMPLWPVLIGALAFLAVAAGGKERRSWSLDLAFLVTAVPFVILVFPFIPGVFTSDGTKSVAVSAAIWALLLFIVFPAIDGLIVRHPAVERTSALEPSPV